MKRITGIFLALLLMFSVCSAFAEEEAPKSIWQSIGGWFSQATDDVSDWASQAWEDTSGWVNNAATDAWNWTTGAANDAWAWTVKTANGTWNGITGFFDPPSTAGTPSIVVEPEFPEGTLKMYLGYPVVKTGLDNG